MVLHNMANFHMRLPFIEFAEEAKICIMDAPVFEVHRDTEDMKFNML